MGDITRFYGAFLGRNIIDEDFKEPNFPSDSGFYTRDQWEERRRELLKVKLPGNREEKCQRKRKVSVKN